MEIKNVEDMNHSDLMIANSALYDLASQILQDLVSDMSISLSLMCASEDKYKKAHDHVMSILIEMLEKGHIGLVSHYENNRRVGVCVLTTLSKMHNYEILRLWVVKEYRGKGIGRSIVNEVIKFYKNMDGKKPKICLVSAETAMKFWSKMGFSLCGTHPGGSPVFSNFKKRDKQFQIFCLSDNDKIKLHEILNEEDK